MTSPHLAPTSPRGRCSTDRRPSSPDLLALIDVGSTVYGDDAGTPFSFVIGEILHVAPTFVTVRVFDSAATVDLGRRDPSLAIQPRRNPA